MPLEVQVVSPEEDLFAGPAEFVRAKTVEGDIGILSGHAPLLAQLAAGQVKVRGTEGNEELIDITGGFMTVKDDKVIILASGTGDLAEGQST